MKRLIFPVTKKEAEKSGRKYSSEENKNALFPSQLRELRKKKGISQEKLARDLGVSKSTIGLYETGDTLPDAKTLCDLAVYFDVSADYLLGLQSTPSTDMNIKAICEYTGLSEDTVRLLNVASTMGPLVSSFLCRFFEDIVVADSSSVELACSCIYKAAHAGVISKTQFAPRSSADAEANNMIDSINGTNNRMFQISSAEAEGYFLECAKGILKCNIDGIIEDMVNELSEEFKKAGLVHIEKDQRIWKLIDDKD